MILNDILRSSKIVLRLLNFQYKVFMPTIKTMESMSENSFIKYFFQLFSCNYGNLIFHTFLLNLVREPNSSPRERIMV